MKKVLILAYVFPPYISVGGLRAYSWFQYFKRFNIEPIVVTRQWRNRYGGDLDYVDESETSHTIIDHTDHGAVYRTPYTQNLSNKLLVKFGPNKFKIFRKIISAFYEIFHFHLNFGSQYQLYKEARVILKKEKVDAIIATADPFILFHYANKLSQEFKIPWIADYRDPWSHDISKEKNIFLKVWSSWLEKRIVSKSKFIITVSEFIKFQIGTLIKDKEIFVLQNGYDPELIDRVKDIPQNNKTLNIAYMGTIYNWNPIERVMSAISEFVSRNGEGGVIFNFYGINIADDLKIMIEEQFENLNNTVIIHPKMSQDKLLENLATNNVMLLFNYYSYMGTKIYDFIGLNRAILMCFTDDPVAMKLKEETYLVDELSGSSQRLMENLIREIDAGYIAKDFEHFIQILEDLKETFDKQRCIPCGTKNRHEYSRIHNIEKLAELIKSRIE